MARYGVHYIVHQLVYPAGQLVWCDLLDRHHEYLLYVLSIVILLNVLYPDEVCGSVGVCIVSFYKIIISSVSVLLSLSGAQPVPRMC